MAEKRVFDGIKVLDFTWAAIGPLVARYLAMHGATVVKVESQVHIDGVRMLPPYIGGKVSINAGFLASEANINKYALGINLAKPKGPWTMKEIVKRWQPDIITENFTPKTMSKWGLDYNSVKEIKSDIIFFSSCQMGQDGIWSDYPGLGHLAAAMAGYFEMTGWPDRGPSVPFGAFSDFVCPPLAISAVIAALEYRRRTGKGRHIDLSQLEGAVSFFSPLIMDFFATGRQTTRQGNRDEAFIPHGVYPCQGEERWIAISVTNDVEWKALCEEISSHWCCDERFSTFLLRRVNEDSLNQLLSAWTQEFIAEELMSRLQKAGVPAAVVQNSADLYEDPHLAERTFFRIMEHPEGGTCPVMRVPFQMSKTPDSRERLFTAIGRDNEYVMRELAGFSDEEISELVIDGVVEVS
ncbi:MAG: CoA transferase [Thermodesulfobacteriota bacterium]|nr:CoA transferase [Thermodesulfobacteriota bacterium]